MRRIHLFELEDQRWFPGLIRDAGTAYLAFAARLARHDESMAPKLEEALQRSGEDRIVDLCSGGSGPLLGLVKMLDGAGKRVESVALTDYYPNRGAFERVCAEDDRFHAIDESVDARHVSSGLSGLRTVFSGFHHFKPSEAKEILANAVDDGASIAIFEMVARHPLAVLGMFFVPFFTLLFVPFLRPFRWGWIPLTYVVPVIPLFIFWDGLVSCLRCYSPSELRELTDAIDARENSTKESPRNYDWDIGEYDLSGTPFPGTYLIGTPRRG